MLFTFKRDEEGRERIYVGDVCVAIMLRPPPAGNEDIATTSCWNSAGWVTGLEHWHINSAIDGADEAGFWERKEPKTTAWERWKKYEVTVDVPVADNAALSVAVGGDES